MGTGFIILYDCRSDEGDLFVRSYDEKDQLTIATFLKLPAVARRDKTACFVDLG